MFIIFAIRRLGMYSGNAKGLIEKAGARQGDTVSVDSATGRFEGVLMPRIESGDRSCIVLKLDSGYNIGIDGKSAKVRLVKKTQEREKKQEVGGMIEGRQPSHISLLSTGGTISSKIEYKTGAVVSSLSARDLAEANPRLSQFGPIDVKSVFSIMSEDMQPSHWETLAKEAAAAFSDGAQGVVITHGTDTLGYSAAALSYALSNLPGPVILTGSQRSSDRGSSDAPQNLLCSCAAARGDFAIVGACMHEGTSDTFNALHIGTRVRKSHTSTRAAFRSVGVKPAARINADTCQIEKIWEKLPVKSTGKPSVHAKFSDNVHLAWMYPGLNKKTVEKWSDYDGVVIAATGLGHVNVFFSDMGSKFSVLKPLEELISSGVPVVFAPQALSGRLNLNVYAPQRMLAQIGVIGHGADWLPETAYVKLCWALGQAKDSKKVAEIMMKPAAFDITDKSAIDDLE
jgi:glutamyl-tRNA(Gln) amidotransferase subunit D